MIIVQKIIMTIDIKIIEILYNIITNNTILLNTIFIKKVSQNSLKNMSDLVKNNDT